MTCTIEINLTPRTAIKDRHHLLQRGQQLANEGYTVHVTELFCDELPERLITRTQGMNIGTQVMLVDLPADSVKPDNSTTAGWIKTAKVRERWTLTPARAETPRPGCSACTPPAARPACTHQAGCSPCQAQHRHQLATALRCMQQLDTHLQGIGYQLSCSQQSVS